LKPYTKIYLKHFGYDVSDRILCEVCGAVAVDIHHIRSRGMGGSSGANDISNLMAVCRECHVNYGDKKQYIDFLTQIHQAKCQQS
jgi:5-methylcytosine-specific restriction endonuclease McrA